MNVKGKFSFAPPQMFPLGDHDTVGFVRSTTIDNACEATDSPLTPVAFAVTDFVPSVTVPNEQEKAPNSFAMHADPEREPSTYT